MSSAIYIVEGLYSKDKETWKFVAMHKVSYVHEHEHSQNNEHSQDVWQEDWYERNILIAASHCRKLIKIFQNPTKGPSSISSKSFYHQEFRYDN